MSTHDPIEPAAAKPVLSICIPTYNRAPYLDYLLSQALATWRFSFSYEIVISDNGSSDQTDAVARKYSDLGLPIRYFRQSFNKGGGPNGQTVLHRAIGSYIVYVGDDDLLNIEGLEAGMAQLQANPELQALYAPWELYDGVTRQTSGQFFTLAEDVTFRPGQELELLGFMVKHHIFPEHMIYRADTVRVILNDPPFCYWAYVYLAHIVARGPIHFSKTPFYRSIGIHPVAPRRSQAGVEQTMTDWDTYRGGLEYFVYVLLKRRSLNLNEDGRKHIKVVIDAFIRDRMRVALRLWTNRGDYVCAYNLIARIHHLDPNGRSDVSNLAGIQSLAATQLLARFTNAIAEVDHLILAGERDIPGKRAALVSLGLREDLTVSADLEHLDARSRRDTIVFIQREEDRRRIVDLGYLPGLVISEADIHAGLYLV